jgi:glycosyltransferase involved in cell wall biosynthesis
MQAQGGVLSFSRLSIFMPAYNASSLLAETVNRIPKELWNRVSNCWIINDGSRDDTSRVIYSLASANNKIFAVHFDKNRGFGEAVKKGLSLCLKDGCEMAVCLHADGQYPPEKIGEFAEAVSNNQYDILQGSRIASGTAISGGMPRYKYIAGKMLTRLENLTFGLQMTDYHSGFMFYSRKAIESLPWWKLSSSFDFDLEMIASARAAGLKTGEMPIPTRYAGETSHLNPVTYGLRALGVLAKYKIGYYRKIL